MEVLKESKSEKRNNQFQKSFNAEKLRRKRDEGVIELRKQKRTQQVSKKRALNHEVTKKPEEVSSSPQETLVFDISWISPELSISLPSLQNPSLQAADRINLLLIHIQGLADIQSLYHSIQTLRKILSNEGVPPLHFIMSSGISPKLISLLNSEYVPLQTECMWCILNLATGPTHIVKMLIDEGVIDALNQLLCSPDQELLELCVWCIGNLAGDSVYTRDKLVQLVPSLMQLLNKIPVSRWKNIIWTLSNLCRGKPLPDIETTKQVLAIVPAVLQIDDEEIISDCCWALSYISDGDCQRIQDILDLGILDTLIGLLAHESEKVVTPCLRTLGNIATGNEKQTQQALNLGLVDKISPFLTSKKISLKREVLWTLSNSTAGSDEQINLVLSHPCIGTVISSLNSPDFELKKEALWTISNATHAASPELALKVIELGAFPLICEVLCMKDSKILLVVLEAINNLLRAGNHAYVNDRERNNQVALKFDEIGGLTKMEELQNHPNVKIYKKVVEIMEEHYGLEEVTDENEPPSNPPVFAFN